MKGKKVLVVGLARSGVAAAQLLLAHGASVVLNDIKGEAELEASLKPILEENQGSVTLELAKDPTTLLDGCDSVMISPGVPVNSPVVIKAREMGIPVFGELELAYTLSQGRVIAITGTNGKTTTTALTGEIFKNAGKLTYVVGNIGIPYSSIAAGTQAGDVVVTEVSSFQLETIDRFHPHVSAVLNITEDHLDRHGTMSEYIRLKERIFENQRPGDYTVLNWDDPATRDMAERCMSKPVFFSRATQVPFGAWIMGKNIVFTSDEGTRPVCKVSDVRIPGLHNLENALAAACIACVSDVPMPVVRHTLRTFGGIEHRLEFVRELGGVRYINDSKGTNPVAAIKAVQAMTRPTVLIAGGYDKHTDFTELAMQIRDRVDAVVLIGDTAKIIAETLDKVKYSAYSFAVNLGEAIDAAREIARDGYNVLLSPACSSFDQFEDYEERGRVFKSLVMEIKEEPELDAGAKEESE